MKPLTPRKLAALKAYILATGDEFSECVKEKKTMAERPILFSDEMIRAILDGRKTQTRRVMRPQPAYNNDWWEYNGQSFLNDSDLYEYLFHEVYGTKGSPYGSVYNDDTSDSLWVRETWQAQNHNGQWWHEVSKNERGLHNWGVIDKATPDPDLSTPPKWIPCIFMPRWASRITLKLTDIRIEQVQDISESDAKAEGVNSLPDYVQGIWNATDRFMMLWDKINAKRGYSWQSNPWVWVVEFKAIKLPLSIVRNLKQ
jgi:hypothetical protein